jgi:hypothetical protein
MEDDLRFLAINNFKQWSNFVMTRHFRMELNIGAEAPLPKIMEDKRGEDGDMLSEADPRELYPVKEEEKINIENTRDKLCEWFPI